MAKPAYLKDLERCRRIVIYATCSRGYHVVLDLQSKPVEVRTLARAGRLRVHWERSVFGNRYVVSDHSGRCVVQTSTLAEARMLARQLCRSAALRDYYAGKPEALKEKLRAYEPWRSVGF